MSDNLRILLVLFSFCLFILVLNLMSKNKIPIRYSLYWIVASILIFIVGAFPDFIALFTNMAGFETTANFVIGIILAMLLAITLILTIIVSAHKKKIKLLIQEVSMLKREVEKGNKNEK